MASNFKYLKKNNCKCLNLGIKKKERKQTNTKDKCFAPHR